jgi:hypothetical protein
MSATQSVELARNGDIVVHRKSGMSVDEFRREHLYPGVPVVIADATVDWPARKAFTWEFFRERYGSQQVEARGTRYRLDQFIDMLERSTFDNPAPYPGKLSLDHEFAELMSYVQPRVRFATRDRLGSRWIPARLSGGAANYEVFLGGPGGGFPYVHYDYMGLHAWINQLVGEKEFIVVPPWQTEYVYPDPRNPWVSRVDDLKNPDLERFPLAAKATVLSFVVGPGETMFIPNGWWHTTISRTMTISVAFDLLDSSNWHRFENEVRTKLVDVAGWKRAAAMAYLSGLGSVMKVAEQFGMML